jgi:hypothetical protein
MPSLGIRKLVSPIFKRENSSIVQCLGSEISLISTLQSLLMNIFLSSLQAQLIAQSIGQAFQVAYMEFLKANGIEDPGLMKEVDYQEVLNQQEIFGEELYLFSNKEMQKEVIVPKLKAEPLGVSVRLFRSELMNKQHDNFLSPALGGRGRVRVGLNGAYRRPGQHEPCRGSSQVRTAQHRRPDHVGEWSQPRRSAALVMPELHQGGLLYVADSLESMHLTVMFH